MLRMMNKRLFLEIIIVLTLIQASRAILVQIIRTIYEPAVSFHNLSLIMMGIILCFVYKPNLQSIILDMQRVNRRTKLAYTAIILILLILIVLSPILYTGNVEDIRQMLEAVLLFPVFEELLFRGYIWNRLEREHMNKNLIYIITTILFGLWHLGYWDVISIKASESFASVNMRTVMFYKVCIGLGYGACTGCVRLKTKNTYSSILLHSFLNIFGR